MFISLGLALLSQSSIAAAKVGSGLKVYPDTGPLENFKGVGWRYNGEMRPWGSHNDLELVPTVKDGSAALSLGDHHGWVDFPEITSVFSLERPYDHSMSTEEAVAFQTWIATHSLGNDGNSLALGSPSINGSHGSIDQLANSWLGGFDKKCTGDCHWDFLALEYEGDNAAELNEVIKGLHEQYSKPIWIKSFICTTRDNLFCSANTAQSFMMDSIKIFRASDFVERWAWDGADPKFDAYGDPTGMLMIEDGVLSFTPTGHLYLQA